MRSYFALQGRTSHPGGWVDCLAWARERAIDGPPVRILTARAGEHVARVVAEVTPDGERLITGGRTVKLSKIRRG